MEIDLLLNEVIAIQKKYEQIYSKTGSYFNIFSIAGIKTDEVRICRIITELLNQKGSHYQKDKYLKLFVKDVLKMDIEESEYREVQVYREYLITENRRIDIVIKFKDYFIPIEVKINAEDQEKQCYDYVKYAEKKSKKEVKLFYLTLDGHIPSEKSAGGLTPIIKDKIHILNENKDDIIEELEQIANKGQEYDIPKYEIIGYEEVQIISFREDIIQWLESCLADTDTMKIAPIREVLLQFMSTIRSLTNLMEDDETMEIVDKIMQSKDSMKAACGIANVIDKAKKNMMERIFKDIEVRMKDICDKYSISKESTYNYYTYENKVKDYYKKHESSYPGLNYLCKNVNLENNLQLWFRIEVDYNLFCGFCLFDKEVKTQFDKCTDNIYDEIAEKTKLKCRNKGSWWIDWTYLPDDDIKPDFKGENNLFELYDKEYYKMFIDRCMDKIEEVLKMI